MKKKTLLLALAAIVAMPALAIAGVGGDPIDWTPTVPKAGNDQDATGALVLLGLLGMVIAGSALNGRTTGKATMVPPTELEEEN